MKNGFLIVLLLWSAVVLADEESAAEGASVEGAMVAGAIAAGAMVEKAVAEASETNTLYQQPVSELLQKRARVYQQGDMLTDDYQPERVNIELDEEGNIVRIWLG